MHFRFGGGIRRLGRFHDGIGIGQFFRRGVSLWFGLGNALLGGGQSQRLLGKKGFRFLEGRFSGRFLVAERFEGRTGLGQNRAGLGKGLVF